MKQGEKTYIFLILYLSYCCIYVARLNLSMASPGLTDIRILDTAKIGIMGSLFSVIYSIGRLLNGVISDKKAPWLMIFSGLFLCGVSNICISFFPPYIAIIMFWSLNAFAQSMLWSSLLCVLSGIYDEASAKKKVSLMVTSVAAGNILGIILNTYIISSFGLASAFLLPGAFSLVFAAIVALTLRDVKQRSQERKHISFFGLLRNSSIRLTLLPAMIHGAMKDNISLWMTVYFVDTYNIDLKKSALFVLLIPIVGFIGRFLYPVVYKIFGYDENKVSVFGFILCAVSSIMLIFKHFSPQTAAILLSVVYMSVSIINTSILSIFPIRFTNSGNVASVSGIMDFATYLGAGISALVYGYIIKFFGYGVMFASWSIISIIAVFFIFALFKQKIKQDSEINKA